MGTASDVLRHLDNYALKKQRSGYYSCNSPLRANSDSGAFLLYIEDEEHGGFTDKVSGEKGSLYELADKLGIERPQGRQQVSNSLIEYKGLEDYATSKGATAEAFEAAGWSRDIVTWNKRPALKFKTRGGDRVRYIDGLQPKFGSVTGYKTCWYGLDTAIGKADSEENILIVANGEPSVVVAQSYGLPVCCITSGENKHIPSPLLEEFKSKWKGRVVVALDCDNTGREGAGKLVQDFTAAGYEVRAIDLLLDDKGDVGDFVKLHGETAYRDMMACPVLEPAVLIAAPPVPPAKAPAQPITYNLGKILYDLKAARQGDNKESQLALISRAQAEINMLKSQLAVTSVSSAGDLLHDYEKELDARKAAFNGDAPAGYSHGIHELDSMLGRNHGGIFTILAETGMGKTHLSTSIVSNLTMGTWSASRSGYIQQPAAGLVVATETAPFDWISQSVAHQTGINTADLADGNVGESQIGVAIAVLGMMGTRGLRILDSQNPTPEAIESAVLAGIVEYGYKWVLIDSGSNVTVEGADGVYQETKQVMDMIQRLSRLGLMVFNTWQTGRNVTVNPAIPQPDDAQGGSRVEQNTDILLAFYNHNKKVALKLAKPIPEFPEDTVYVRCLKHRRRGNAEGKWANLKWVGGCGVYSLLPDGSHQWAYGYESAAD